MIVNLSASNELVAKADYRRDLVRMASAQGICAYLYAGSGPTESTKDIVFGGHSIIAENGSLLDESDRFDFSGTMLIAEFDWQKLRHDRARNSTFAASNRPKNYYFQGKRDTPQIRQLQRAYPQHPFVPDDVSEVSARASEILKIQSTGLARRVMASHANSLVLGLSGGLDSTLALLVCIDALTILKRDHSELTCLLYTSPSPRDRG